MKEEIKDILELLRDGVKRPVVTLSKYSLDNICELNPNECKKLLEYIENLQSQLKAKEETINKAIKHVSSLSSKGRGCEIYADVKRDILEILSKGENKWKNYIK